MGELKRWDCHVASLLAITAKKRGGAERRGGFLNPFQFYRVYRIKILSLQLLGLKG